MKDNCYLQSKRGPCPICAGTLTYSPSGLFKICIDCKSVFRILQDDLKFGGDGDEMLEDITKKEQKDGD